MILPAGPAPVVSAVPVQPADPNSSAPSQGWLPGRGVLSGGLAALVSWLIIAILHRVGLDVPFELQSLLPPLIGYTITYVVPPTARDVAKRLNDQIVALAAAMPGPVSQNTVVVPDNAKVVAVKP